jgi:hypothetical protein
MAAPAMKQSSCGGPDRIRALPVTRCRTCRPARLGAMRPHASAVSRDQPPHQRRQPPRPSTTAPLHVKSGREEPAPPCPPPSAAERSTTAVPGVGSGRRGSRPTVFLWLGGGVYSGATHVSSPGGRVVVDSIQSPPFALSVDLFGDSFSSLRPYKSAAASETPNGTWVRVYPISQ